MSRATGNDNVSNFLKNQIDSVKNEPIWTIKSPVLKDETKNACLKEGNLVNRCMTENNYDKDSCKDAFDNYKLCNSFWLIIKKKRKRLGIEPYLPPPEERERVKAEEINLMKKLVKEFVDSFV